MDNYIFNKRLKTGAIVVASIVVVLLIVWFATKGGQSCINNNNCVEALTFEEAIQVIYDNNDISESPKKYVDFEESVAPYYHCSLGEIRILKLIDNYRLFLSDDAECNIDGESLKSFICKICSDKSFLKSRMSDMMKNLEMEDLPTFKFCCEIESVKSMFHEKGLIIGRINSWLSLEKDYASYIRSNNNMTIDTYVFTRINGEWYLSMHMY